jgi:hypothetical protein
MVTIGVTGHQTLAEVEKLEAGLDEVAHRLEVAFPEEWRVMSALAEGADRLVANRLMARKGTRLLAVLPMSRQEYETDFETGASKKEFGDLLDDADEVMEIPPQSHRDDAYEAGGSAVLEESDVLVAVWDGQAAQGIGGTGGIVAEARKRKMPLAWIHAGNRKPGTIEPTTLGEEQGAVTFESFPQLSGGSAK